MKRLICKWFGHKNTWMWQMGEINGHVVSNKTYNFCLRCGHKEEK